MQVQKHLYRISEKTLRSQNSTFYFSIILYVSLIFAIINILIFGYGHTVVLNDNNELSNCFRQATKSNFKIQEDALYILQDSQIQEDTLAYYKKVDQIQSKNSFCTIIRGMNSSTTIYPVVFTHDYIITKMNPLKRQQLNFVNYTIFLPNVKSFNKVLFGFDILMMNELVYNQQKKFYSDKIVIKTQESVLNHSKDDVSTVLKIGLIAKSLLFYLILSIITSLYIYGTIIAAPAVIIMCLKCNCFNNGVNNFNDIYKIFPWVGMHTLIRQSSQNPQIKKSGPQVCASFVYYFFILYLIYYAGVVQISELIFRTHIEMSVAQTFYGYIAMIEFAAIIFIRTRTFIRYFPAIHSLLMLLFIYYGQVCEVGLKRNAAYACFCLSIAVFAWMVIKLEIPAQNTWDRTQNYTPTIDRPRIGFFPLFNMSWISNLPEQWSLMVPLFSRQHFTTQEMALVDRNFEELDQVLGNNHPQ